jgi:hypothetical protein
MLPCFGRNIVRKMWYFLASKRFTRLYGTAMTDCKINALETGQELQLHMRT